MKRLMSILLMSTFTLGINAQCIVGNCEEGYGEYIYESGNKYEGYFSDGKKEGKGIFTWKNGGYYKGDWYGDKRHGYCIEKNSRGWIYEGEYRYDKRHGLGTLYDPTGKIDFAGTYNDGQQISNTSNLPKEIQADKLLLEAKKLMENKSYTKAVVSFNKILLLNVSPPNEFYFYLGKSHYKSENYKRAISNLTTYLTNAGKNGEYYIRSLEILGDAEANVNNQELEFSKNKLAIENCDICGGDGYYKKKIKCDNCYGSGTEEKYKCYTCSGSGSLDCKYCERGVVNNYSSGGGVYRCKACKYGSITCTKCWGSGKRETTCSICSGSGKVLKTFKCNNH